MKKRIFIVIFIFFFISNSSNINAKYLDSNNIMNFIASEKIEWKINNIKEEPLYYGKWQISKQNPLTLSNIQDTEFHGTLKISENYLKDKFKKQIYFPSSTYAPYDQSTNLQIIYRPIFKRYQVEQVEILGNGLSKTLTGNKEVAYVNVFAYWDCSYQYTN